MSYGIRIDEHDCGQFGMVKYAQWLNPDFIVEWEKVRPMWQFNEAHVKALRQYIRPGDTILDIGAQVGYVMMPMMLAASPGGRVIAFEPNPQAFEVLKENARLNSGRSEFKIFNRAVLEVPGMVTFHYNDHYTNGGFVTSGEKGIGTAGCTKPCGVMGVELKSFLEQEGITIEHLSFIKIDTEGYDRKILKSIGWLINQHRPVMRIEYFFESSPAEKQELWDNIKALRYRIFWDHYYDGRFTVDGAEVGHEEFMSRPYVCDMLCFPEERS